MKDSTILVHAGRAPLRVGGPVNMTVHRASKIVSPTLEEFDANEAGDAKFRNVCYGALGTENAFALCDAVNRLEQGAGSMVTSSGLAACTQSLLAFVGAGDHVLMPDSVYGPQRMFCDTILRRFGVETTFYDPRIGADIDVLIKANTRVVYTEAPGSLTFEMQDIPAIVKAAHARSAIVIMDNTWAGPLYFKPLAAGVDICVEAATKFIAGHSDLVMGVITARTEELYRRMRAFCVQMGEIASPDDCYMALRGLRTMKVRMETQFAQALELARWLKKRPEVVDVLYPPLEDDPGHAAELLQTFKQARTQKEVVSQEVTEDVIMREIRKEFIGEGCMFLFYKRLFASIYVKQGVVIAPLDANFVFPIPDAEYEYSPNEK